VREPASADALNQLASKDPRVHVIKLVADDQESNKSAVEEVKKVTDRLDIVVANAGTLCPRFPLFPSTPNGNTGINAPFVPVYAESIEHYRSNFEVNTFGPLYLYQATYPLLVNTRLTDPSTSLPPPKFFITSTVVASTGSVPATWVNGPYGASKAAINHIARVIHHQTEESGAVVIPYHPGKPSS
jgi:norsolorinic acid ketoreductase